MKIAGISTATFTGTNQQLTEPKKKSPIKEFFHKKEAPYIIGASAVAAIAIATVAIKKGKIFKTAGVHNTSHVQKPNEIKPAVAENLTPKENVEIKPEISVPKESNEVIKTDNSSAELLKPTSETKISHVVKDGDSESFDRFKGFIKDFDEKTEDMIRQVNNNYVVDNINSTGQYRYKKDYVEVFDRLSKDSESKMFGVQVKENGNDLLLTQKDGKKLVYSFEEGEKGGLKSIKELPNGDNTSITVHYLPDKYWDYGKTGINRIDKIEYHNTDTNTLIQSISIDPEVRSTHSVVLNNPKTGSPVLTIKRTAEPDHLYYDTTFYENNKPCVHVDTKTNSVDVFKD